jgi:hypothetical protein
MGTKATDKTIPIHQKERAAGEEKYLSSVQTRVQ